MVKVAEVELVLPAASVAVKMTCTAPAPPQVLAMVVKSLDQLTPLQLSVAAAPPLLFNQAISSAVLPDPSHSTVSSAAGVPMVGLSLSSTTTSNVALVVLPWMSVAVYVTVVDPRLNVLPEAMSEVRVATAQLSVTVGSVSVTTASQEPGSVDTVSFTSVPKVGASLSVTVTLKLVVAEFPARSVEV